MAIKSRKDVREALGVVLTAELTGAGNPCQAVYDYGSVEFSGLSPVVCIVGSGTDTSTNAPFGTLFPAYNFMLLSYVTRILGAEEAAEDELDNVAQGILDVLKTYRTHPGNWQNAQFTGQSTITPVIVGGDPYWLEQFPLRVEVYSG